MTHPNVMEPPKKPKKARDNKEPDPKWIQKAIKKPGALRKTLGVKKGDKLTAEELMKAEKKGRGKAPARARLAMRLRKYSK